MLIWSPVLIKGNTVLISGYCEFFDIAVVVIIPCIIKMFKTFEESFLIFNISYSTIIYKIYSLSHFCFQFQF